MESLKNNNSYNTKERIPTKSLLSFSHLMTDEKVDQKKKENEANKGLKIFSLFSKSSITIRIYAVMNL